MKVVLIVFLMLGTNVLIGQNEIELVRFNLSNVSGASIVNDDYNALNQISSVRNTLDISLRYGHAIGDKGWEAFYEANYQNLNQQLDFSGISTSSIFPTIPENYYSIPRFSQASLSVGLTKTLANSWSLVAVAGLSVVDDFFKVNLSPNLTWTSLSYVEKQKRNNQLSYGAGLFLNQLENRLIISPLLSFRLQNSKRGIEVLFPDNIRAWHKIKKAGYVEIKAFSNSYSLRYQMPNDVNTTDIYFIKTGLTYHYIWENFLKLSAGITLPVSFYTVDNNAFQYTQQNGFGLHLGISVVLVDH